MDLATAYHEARQPIHTRHGTHWQVARIALSVARFKIDAMATQAEWEQLGGETIPAYEASTDGELGDVRIVEHPDHLTIEDLEGDMFNPDANPDIKPAILERERTEWIEKLDREGVWYYVAEYHDGEAWQTADSIGGIEGQSDDLHGYLPDLQRAAMTQAQSATNASHEAFARALEQSRPDMYPEHV